MESLGYVISEIPTLFFVIWFAVRCVQFRRRRKNQPAFSDTDRRLLFGATRQAPIGAILILKMGIAIVTVGLTGLLEILVLAPMGATILTGVILLTSTAIVHHLLLGS